MSTTKKITQSTLGPSEQNDLRFIRKRLSGCLKVETDKSIKQLLPAKNQKKKKEKWKKKISSASINQIANYSTLTPEPGSVRVMHHLASQLSLPSVLSWTTSFTSSISLGGGCAKISSHSPSQGQLSVLVRTGWNHHRVYISPRLRP